MPAIPASPELSAMVFWVLDLGLTARNPRAPANGPPGAQAPSKVRVDVRANSAPFRPATGS
eukprot:8372862-Alexandrium_andersonii.AAC.1